MTDSSNSPKPYNCPVCDRKFGRSEHLRRHASAHANVKPFQCRFCQKRFARKYVYPRVKLMKRDVLYRHYGCCETARAQSSLPKIETRRACDRCKRFKSRCSGGIPCERCQQASHVCTISSMTRQSSTTLAPAQENRSPTTSSTVSAPQPDTTSITTEPIAYTETKSDPFATSLSIFEPTPDINHTSPVDPFAPTTNTSTIPAFESLDWNFFYSTLQDMTAPDSTNPSAQLLPDFNFDPLVGGFPGMVEPFSPQSTLDETTLDWNFDGFSLGQVDPFESRRLEIIDHLRASCGATPCQLAVLSARNAKVFFHAYFNRFHPHSPFLHIPTFDISKISTAKYFAMLVIGALHCGEADKDDMFRSLWHSADQYVWSHAVVTLSFCSINGRIFNLGHRKQ